MDLGLIGLESFIIKSPVSLQQKVTLRQQLIKSFSLNEATQRPVSALKEK